MADFFMLISLIKVQPEMHVTVVRKAISNFTMRRGSLWFSFLPPVYLCLTLNSDIAII